MDAHTIAGKIMKYWMCIYPKNSGEITKSRQSVKVYVQVNGELHEVSSVEIQDGFIKLSVIEKMINKTTIEAGKE